MKLDAEYIVKGADVQDLISAYHNLKQASSKPGDLTELAAEYSKAWTKCFERPYDETRGRPA
jgi:hypothetical protein